MSYKEKNYITGQTYVVYQKGRRFCTSFYDDSCYRYYTLRLLNSVNNYHVKLHAYCLLRNELFLLVTPGTPTGIGRLLCSLNRSYSEYFTLRFNRPGEVFPGCHWHSLIQGASLILDCQKFIERAAPDSEGLSHPGSYRWSSYCANAFGGKSRHLVPHKAFVDFLSRAPNPHRRYREFIALPFSEAYALYLVNALKFGKAPGKRLLPLCSPTATKRRRIGEHCDPREMSYH